VSALVPRAEKFFILTNFEHIPSEIEIFTPFPAVSNHTSIHTTYLDTTGRPALNFEYRQLTDKHAGIIYVRNYMMEHFRLALTIR
jgi:hypothetical protein